MSEPLPRYLHCSAVVEGKWYNYGGKFRDDHSFDPFLIEEFDPTHQTWRQLRTTGTPPPGHIGSAATSIGSNFFVFGGLSGADWYYNLLFALDLRKLEWNQLQPSDSTETVPQAKVGAEMISYDDRYLVIFGGGFTTNQVTSVAKVFTDVQRSDELLYFDIKTCEWHYPKITGQEKLGLSSYAGCTLTKVDRNRAVLFGGQDDQKHIRILTMSNSDPWSWTLVKPSAWPSMCTFHLAFSLHDTGQSTTDPALVAMFGREGNSTKLTDAWIYWLKKKKWTQGTLSEGLMNINAIRHSSSCLLSQQASSNKKILVQFGGLVEERLFQGTMLTTLEVDREGLMQASITKNLKIDWLLVSQSHPNIVLMEDVKKQTVSLSATEQLVTTDSGISLSVCARQSKNQEVEVSVQPCCLSKSFRFPSEYEAASPVYMLNESKNKAKKTVHVKIEHSVHLENDEDSRNMVFLVSSDLPKKEGKDIVYKFIPVHEPSKFPARENFGEVELTQLNNLLCIGTSKEKSQASNNVYSLKLYTPPDPTSSEHSIVLSLCLMQKAFLKGCSKMMEKEYPNLTCKTTFREPVFFERDRVEIQWDEGAGLTVTPTKDPVILREEADLPLTTGLTLEDGINYPPRIEFKCAPATLQVPTADTEVEDGVCGIQISGLKKEVSFNYCFKHPVMIFNPVVELTDDGNADLEQDGDSNELHVLVGLFGELASKWREIGLALDMSQYQLNIIEQTPLLIPKGLPAYFREMIHQWLLKQPAESDILTKIQHICSALKEPHVGEEVFAEQVLQKVTNLTLENISDDLKQKLPDYQLQVNKAVSNLKMTSEQWNSEDDMIKTSLQVAASLKDMEFQKLSELFSKAKEIKHKCDNIVEAAGKIAEDSSNQCNIKQLKKCMEELKTASEILYKQVRIQLTLGLSLSSRTGHEITVDKVVTSMTNIAKGLEEILKESDQVQNTKWQRRSVVRTRSMTVDRLSRVLGPQVEQQLKKAQEEGGVPFSPVSTSMPDHKLPEETFSSVVHQSDNNHKDTSTVQRRTMSCSYPSKN